MFSSLRLWSLSAFIVFSTFSTFAFSTEEKWVVKNPKWTEANEKLYSEFVQKIFKARKDGKCGKNLAECLRDPSVNSFRNTDLARVGEDVDYAYAQDCGKCPYYLRAYISYHLNLPWSYVASVKARGGGNFRYGRDGSIVLKRIRITTDDNYNPWRKWGSKGKKKTFWPGISGAVHSGMHRFGPKNDWDENSDFYSVAISKTSIKPGLTWYEVNGHVAVVGDVEEDGDVYLFNCHADYTTTAEQLTSEDYIRSRSSQGGGFKAWRPIELVGYRKDPRTGILRGGELRVATNQELIDEGVYSKEQYSRPFVWDGEEIPKFLDYMKTKLSGELIRYNPVEVIEKGVGETCNAVQARMNNVIASVNQGISNKTIEQSSTKGKLPENIYNTHHWEWEVYSSPSRDVAIKQQFVELREKIELMFDLHQKNSPQLLYGSSARQMKQEMRDAYYAAARECEITYTNSVGETVEMDYLEFVKPVKNGQSRLFHMSFDPYHCAERRWGAYTNDEVSTCRQSSTKEAWYFAQQRLRNQVFRDGERQDMNFTLRELQTKTEKDGNGWDQSPDVDVTKLLD